MKIRISATIDPETDRELGHILKKGKHRNKSHIVEDALRLYIDEVKHEKH